MTELQKPDRLRALELRAEHNALTNAEAIELENLQTHWAAQLANPDSNGNSGEYSPGQIDYGYNPKPMSADTNDVFRAMRGQKPMSRWQRFVYRLRTAGRR